MAVHLQQTNIQLMLDKGCQEVDQSNHIVTTIVARLNVNHEILV